MFELINQRQNLCYLRDSNVDIESLCKTATEAISSKIKSTDEENKKLIEILISIYIEISKTKVSSIEVNFKFNNSVLVNSITIKEVLESEFIDEMNSYGFPQDKSLIIYQHGAHKKDLIENILNLSVSLPRFRSLEWRIQCKISSRSCLQKITPLICIKLYLDAEKCGEQRDVLKSKTNDYMQTKQLIIFQTDPNNLLNLISTIEQALLIKKNNL